MGVAAAALIVVVVAFGKLPGPIEHITHLGPTYSASPSATHSSGGRSVSPGGLQGTGAASKSPTASPAPTRDRLTPSLAPSVTPTRLCQELFQAYYSYVAHPGPRSSWPAELSLLYQKVGALARSDNPMQVFDYCRPYLGDTFHREDHAAKANPSPAASSAPTEQGATGSGNGNGGSGPGQGNAGGGPAQNP